MEGMDITISPAARIKEILVNLRTAVDETRKAHDAARLALADALAQFKPVKKGRPANLPTPPKIPRVKKPKPATLSEVDGIEEVKDGWRIKGYSTVYATREEALAVKGGK